MMALMFMCESLCCGNDFRGSMCDTGEDGFIEQEHVAPQNRT